MYSSTERGGDAAGNAAQPPFLFFSQRKYADDDQTSRGPADTTFHLPPVDHVIRSMPLPSHAGVGGGM